MGRNKRKLKKPTRTIEEVQSDNFGKEWIDEPETEELLDDPVDITSRLAFPIIKHCEIESEDEEDDEETIELQFRPRKMFLSNSCLVCSRICDPEYLCKNCQMVSYCTEIHRREDLPSHQDLCKVLSKLKLENNTSELFIGKRSKNSESAEGYRILRVGIIHSTENSLKRYLDLWEKEIILYPRGCFKCHSINERNLQSCPDCKVVFWCEGHGHNHPKWCLEHKIFHKVLLAQANHGNIEPFIPNVYFIKALNLSRNNFDTVMSKINNNSRYIRTMDFYNYITLSHLSSIPLTSLYAFQKSCSNWKNVENFAVHLIGSEFQYEGINLRVWEKLFLHFLPNLKNLKLVITGPELFLPEVPRDLLAKVKLCRRCKSSRKKIDVFFVPEILYHDYCCSSDYQKPDLACLFNPGLYRRTGYNGQDTWPKTIYELCESKVPILVTAYTEREIPMDIERITSVRDVRVVLTPRRNPFASLKPDRNFVSDESVPLIYKNYFLSIVKARV